MVVKDMQQNDILELIDRVREWVSMANRVISIEAFLGLNKETSSSSADGNLDTIRDL